MRTVLLVSGVLALGVAPAVATAAAPSVSTGGAARVQPTTASLTGKVNPRGLSTSYHFQWGKTKTYGNNTPSTPAGDGSSSIAAVADIGALTPNTVYHYRIVATNRDGTARGSDRTFRTKKQPLGLSLAANPNPVTFGGGTTIAGNLSGTGNAGETIILRQNPFPFTAGLQPFGNPVITDTAGNFAVALLNVPITTQYGAYVQGKSVVSPILTVPVAVRVGSKVNHRRVTRGRNVRFTGSIRPARPGAQVAIQKLGRRSGKWVTVAGTITRHR
ncbi:MAG TPA: hypothetical protein VFZ89_06530, partial [Solirubrobacteraceae bacterium]